MTTMEEVAGWLRDEARRVYEGWVDLVGHERASEKAEKWNTRAAQVEAMGWRPIEEAPRSIEYRCLLYNGITVVTGYWDGSRWVNERSVFRSAYPATHFMPLPQPPVNK